MALTQGFRNAPKIYGDKTVRPTPTITGFTSGVSTAGQELVTGLYDGLSGFVMEPIEGAKESGPSGFAKGVGKGIGGVVLKPCAGMYLLLLIKKTANFKKGACGMAAYAWQGVHVEINKLSIRSGLVIQN
jgi:hypothetical protein